MSAILKTQVLEWVDDQKQALNRRLFLALPRFLPFIILLTGMIVAFYGGFAHRRKPQDWAAFRLSHSLS